MICKGKSITHTVNAIGYGISKSDSREICREGLGGENAQEIAQEIRLIQQLNSNCTNNLLRIELSPSIGDGLMLTDQDWEAIARDLMLRLNLHDNRQWICIQHKDREHKHLHIYANRIDFNGKAYNDSYFTLKCGKAAEQIAIERGMTTAMSVHLTKQQALQPLKERISEAHKAIVRKGLSPSQYQSLMKQKGIEVVFNQSKTTGRITGMSFIVSGTKIKASDVSRTLGFNKLFGIPREPTSQKLTPRQRLIGQNHSHIDSIKYHITRMFSCNAQVHARPERAEDEEQKNELNFDL